jgi:hypothetical protein
MRFENIADIYQANADARQKLVDVLNGVSTDEATRVPDGEKWTIQQIVEHIAIVDGGTARICSKLLDEAENAGAMGDGQVSTSAEFGERSTWIAGVKVEAPDRVRPTGNVPIAESLAKLSSTRELFDSLRSRFESLDLSNPRFTHPFLGDLTAAEWLIVAGGHTARHTKQIERLLTAMRQ